MSAEQARSRRRLGVALLAILVALGGGGVWWWLYKRPSTGQKAAPLLASGTLEAMSVSLQPQVGGRVVELTVAEGQEVISGTVIARLDRSPWLAQRAQAEAALIAARAQLAQVEAGSRPEAVAAARAALEQAVAERDRVYRAWQYALTMRKDPQELNVKIAQAEAELAVAKEEVIQQQALLAQRTASRDRYHYPQREWHFLNYLTVAAQEGLLAAQAKRDGAARHLANLRDMRDRPLALNARVHAAQAVYRAAEATVLQRQAELDEAEAGPTAQELAMAQAQVALYEARLRTIDVYLRQTEIVAPLNGTVTDLPLKVGELATPGAPVAILANLDRMTLRVYVPERELSHVYLGQKVRVSVDAFPGESFTGHVVYISDKAEFTPRSIHMQEERAKMVFAIEIRVSNPDHRLKPGLPADAEFVE